MYIFVKSMCGFIQVKGRLYMEYFSILLYKTTETEKNINLQ